MDAHRADDLTPQRVLPGHGTDQVVRRQRDTFTDEQVAVTIDELEHELRRDDAARAGKVDRRHRALTRNDVAMFSLLVAAIVLLAIALATTSALAWLGGVTTYLASFAVHDRQQGHRLLRRRLTSRRVPARGPATRRAPRAR